MANLRKIEGIGEAFAEKLAEAGILTTDSLLRQGASPAGRQQIAEKTGIDKALILKWVNQADLIRIKGVGEEYADLLEASGVDTVPELAQRNPANLYQKIVVTNEKVKLVRQIPSESMIESWVAQAQQLARAISFSAAGAEAVEEESQVLSKQATALVEQNRRLAERLDAAMADLARFREAALGLDDAIKEAREKTETRLRAEFAAVEEQFEARLRSLKAQVADLERQVSEQGKIVQMPPERVASLVNGLVDQLQGSMRGLSLRDGEIRLKVGFGGAGERAGFVLPTPDSGPEIKDSLHEVVLRFSRAPRPPSK